MLGVTVKNLIESYESMHINILLTDKWLSKIILYMKQFNKDLHKLTYKCNIKIPKFHL